MLVIAVQRSDRPRLDSFPALAHQRVAFSDRFVCDVYFDKGRFAARLTDDALTIEEATAGLGTIWSLGGRDFTATLTKPLLLGLPLYFAAADGLFVASTHVRPLGAFGVSLADDPSVLPEYFIWRYVTPPRTLLKHVRSLPVGGSLTVAAESDRVRTSDVIWTKVFERDRPPMDLSSGVDLFKRDLEEQFERLRPWRGAVACLLSGGLDSSALYKLGKDILSLQDSHSTGYPFEDQVYEKERGERHYAETAAVALGSAHQFHTYTNEQFLHGMIESIDNSEAPLLHVQSIMLNLLFKHGLKPTDRIVLNGQGADGIVGLTFMFHYLDKKYLLRREFAPLLRLASAIISESSFPFGRLHRWSLRSWNMEFNRADHALWMMGEFGERGWVRSHFGVDDAAIAEGRMAAIGKFKVDSALDAFSILDFVSDVGVTQGIWGRLAAAHGKTAYYPFNSPGLIRASLHVPWEEKLSRPKRLMVTLGERLGVPDFILQRPKIGFGISSARWSMPGGLVEPLLDVAGKVVDVELVRRFQGADEKRAMIYWNWLNYGIWKRLVVDGESRQKLTDELNSAIENRRGNGRSGN